MKKLLSLLTVLASSVVTVAAASAGQPLSAAATIGLSATSGLRDLGPAPAAMRIELALIMAYRHSGDLAALIDAQSDPRSPAFRHFLSQAQFDAYFAPAAADYAATMRALRRRGFEITRSYADRSIIHAAAPVATVDATFGAAIHRVAQPGAGNRYAALGAPLLPSDLRGTVATVVGMDNLGTARPQQPRTATASLPSGTHAAVPASVLVGPDQGYSAPAIAIAYDYPVEHGFDGRGVKVADVVPSVAYQANVTTYLKQFGVKQTGPSIKNVTVDGGGCGIGCFADIATFDAEQVLGTAPGVALSIYVPAANVGTFGIAMIDAFQKAIADGNDIVFSSLASCELDNPPYDKAVHNIAQHGTALGVTFETLSLHGNAACFARNSPTIDQPTDDPLFVALSGTDLKTDVAGRYQSESVNGVNGGVSLIFPLPAYQSGVPGMIRGGRNTPDITSAASINGRAAAWYLAPPGCNPQNGVCGWVGGIYSAPFINNSAVVGLLAEVNQVRGGRSGLLNAQLYDTWRRLGYRTKQGTQLFHDITVGVPPGYDHTTGIGSVDGWNLARALR